MPRHAHSYITGYYDVNLQGFAAGGISWGGKTEGILNTGSGQAFNKSPRTSIVNYWRLVHK
jgi:hypothetical protein